METDPLITIGEVFLTKLVKLEKNNIVNSQNEAEKDPLEMEESVDNDDDEKKLDFEEVEVDKKVSLAQESETALKYDPDGDDHELEADMDAGMEEIRNILKIEIPTDDMEDVTTKLRVEAAPPVKIPIPLKLSSLAAKNEIVINHHKNPKKKPCSSLKHCLCTLCNTGFPNQHLYQIHLSEFHADKRPFPCKVCGKAFDSRTNQKRHETIHDKNRFQGEPQFACELCDKKYHLKASLVGHRKLVHFGYKKPPSKKYNVEPILEHHSVGVRNHNRPKKEPTVFKCPDCDLKFAMRCYLMKHMLVHNKEGTPRFICEICNQPFTQNNYRLVHMRIVHSNTASTGPRPGRPRFMSKEPCPCSICGKDLQTPSRLARHMLLHTGEKPHECPDCNRRFRAKQTLNFHRRHMHPTGRGRDASLLLCRVCGKGFLSVSDLQRHRNRKIKNHREITFISEKEKWFGCGVCSKPFYFKEDAIICTLLKHDPRTLHAAMFRFKCQECPNEDVFAFHSTWALRKHWEKKHPDKPFPNQYRATAGFYSKEDKREDPLPNVSVPKILAKSINENGPSPEAVEAATKDGIPLYIEYGLMSESELVSRGGTTMKPDEIYNDREQPQKTKPLIIKREMNVINNAVDINDVVAVKQLLGYRSVRVKLTRLCESDDSERQSAFNNKTNSVNINDTAGIRRLLNCKLVYVRLERL